MAGGSIANAGISAAWDDEAKVWYVRKSDIPGLATEADTLEALQQRVRDIIPDLLDDWPKQVEPLEISFEL